MKKYYFISAITFTAIVLVCFIHVHSQNMPSAFSTVSIKNFTPRIWAEDFSLYMITSEQEILLIATPYQTILSTKNNNNRHAVLIKAGKNKDYAQLPFNKDMKDTRLLQLTHPLVQSYAKKIKASSNIVNEVEQLIYTTIETKTEGIPIIPAPVILETKKGDCTEHAVAAIALLRTLKIPARAVVGMIAAREYAGRKNVFVFHMWAEAYYNNAWILVDATRPGAKKPNLYIALTYHSLETEMPLEFLEAMAAIQNLTVTYLSE